MATVTTQIQKMEVDYSATVSEKIPECEKLAKVGITKNMYTYASHIFKYRSIYNLV